MWIMVMPATTTTTTTTTTSTPIGGVSDPSVFAATAACIPDVSLRLVFGGMAVSRSNKFSQHSSQMVIQRLCWCLRSFANRTTTH